MITFGKDISRGRSLGTLKVSMTRWKVLSTKKNSHLVKAQN